MADAESIAMLAEALIGELIDAGQTVATAESCTGGWIAKALTDVSGSSAAFGYGVVSYSNEAKASLLGVGDESLRDHGAVSEAVVTQMAAGILRLSGADLAVAVSGIAGPDGGTEEKPVGTVWLAWAASTSGGLVVDTERRVFDGDRDSVRVQTVILALQGLRERCRKRG
jgi:nicotinamide-nucleotide amidase